MGPFLRSVKNGKALNHVSHDILGDAYEWILKYFAPQKAKKGEVYTAREVIKLIVEMLDPNRCTRGRHRPQ
jgi:type I restriction enzyme M protein